MNTQRFETHFACAGGERWGIFPTSGPPVGEGVVSKAERTESADKPGSVEGNHSSGIRVATDLKQPTREQRGPRLWVPYLALLRVGFTVPLPLPVARCALTAPFHPYLCTTEVGHRRFVFCCTGRRLTPPRRYLAPCPMEPGLSSTHETCSDCLADSGAHGTGNRQETLISPLNPAIDPA